MIIYNSLVCLLIVFSIYEILTHGKKIRTRQSVFSFINNSDCTDDKFHNYIFIFIILILFAISSSRYETVGTDMSRYVPRFHIIAQTDFKNLSNLPENWRFEYGFVLFCKLISYIFGDNIFYFILISSFIVVFGIYKFLKTYSLHPIISCLIYVCYGYWGNSFNIVRQSMAISLLIWALVEYEKKNIKPCIILCLFAFSIHSTSIVFLVIFVLKKYRYTKKTLITFIGVSMFIYILPSSFLNFFLSFSEYGGYINRAGSGETTILVLTVLLFVSFFMKSMIYRYDTNIDLWLWMLSISISTGFLAMKIGLFERIMRYFLVSILIIGADLIIGAGEYFKSCLTIQCFLCEIKVKTNTILGLVIIGMFVFYYYYIVMATPAASGGIIPYQFYFEQA